MFGLRRKIGTGATSRRRPARECKVGVEGLDARVVPSITVSAPGSPIVESGLPSTLNVSFDEYGHAFASFTQTVTPATATTPAVTKTLLVPLVATTAAVPGVTGGTTGNPVTLAYHLPTAVNPGDVAVVNFQTGALSDVLRFTDAISTPGTNTLDGWLLVYSDNAAETETDSPADVAAFPPTGFNPVSPLNGVALEFGVQGLDVAEYVATPAQTVGGPPEQANYSFLSDGNLIPTTGG